jgi:bifunctional UDP-N-acetylglucosamine pyrophosphorylase/glucosamine-1-phosphate N-acetyltransferase
MSQDNLLTIILAAGKGTRMKSELPKVLHRISGKPMIQHVLDAAKNIGAVRQIVVAGFGAELVKETLGSQAEYVVQTEQLGTGHAVMTAKDALADFDGTIMVLCGDTPLLTSALLKNLYSAHKKSQAKASVLTAVIPDPLGYGRVITTPTGHVIKIVEQKDASPEELLVNEINTGIYCFEKNALLSTLDEIKPNNAQGEYYLTDAVGILTNKGIEVIAIQTDDISETMGVNSRVHLAEAEKILKRRKLVELMESGVTIIDPDSVFVDADVVIGKDTVIYPFTMIEGQTKIGSKCEIGPNTRLQNVTLGDHVVIHFSYAHNCRVDDDVNIGPYVHLRPDANLAKGVKVGNFVEVKNSSVGKGSKIPHLSYIGDTDMGEEVNIGSGTITVNYDGMHKHRTTIKSHAFVGCNTNLVAPVTIEEGAYIAAGSTITKNVPEGALGVGRARQSNIENWKEKTGRK